MTYTPSQWIWHPDEQENRSTPVTVNLITGDGEPYYLIRQSGCCMDARGTWEPEMVLIARPKMFSRFQFTTFIEAANAVRKHVKHPLGRHAPKQKKD